MTLLEQLGRSALLGTQRAEQPASPVDNSALSQLLSLFDPAQPEALLLNAAGALSIYEQIGRLPRRLGSRPEAEKVNGSEAAFSTCPVDAAASLFIMLNGTHQDLLPELLTTMAAAHQTAPALHMPNLLDHGTRNVSTRRLILPVLDQTGRWLAGQNPDWRWAAPGVESWDATVDLWKTDKASARQTLLRQQRMADPTTGLRLLQTTWKSEDPTRCRAGLIGVLESGLHMGDEPFLEIALDDRIHAVRKKAAELLARLPNSRLCQRMVQNTVDLFHWEPATEEKIRLTFPDEFDPLLFRDGVLKRSGTDLARIRSSQLVEIVGAIPLDQWTTSWNATPEEIVGACAASKWPTSLLRGFTLAAERQQRVDWAHVLLRADGFSLNTVRLISLLPLADFEPLVQELDVRLAGDELISKECVLVKVLRKWTHVWTLALVQHWLPRLNRYIAQDVESKTPDTIMRSVLRQLARQVAPAHIPVTMDWLRPMVQDNIWRPAVLEALSILAFRQRMLSGMGGEVKASR